MKPVIAKLIMLLVIAAMVTAVWGGVPAQGSTVAAISIPETDKENAVVLNIKLTWQELLVEQVVVEGKTFSRLSLEGANNTDEPGLPALPAIAKAIGAPVGADVAITVTPGASHILNVDAPVLPGATQNASIDPAVLLAGGDNPVSTLSAYIPNPSAYQSNAFYPVALASVVSDGFLRSQRVLGIQVSPVQYNPLQGTLLVYEELTVTVRFKGSRVSSSEGVASEQAEFENLLSQTLENYTQAQYWRQDQEGNNSGRVENDTNGIQSETAAAPWQPPEPGYRIAVEETGIYKIGYDQLSAAGLPVDTINPQSFQMFYQGNEISVLVSGEADGVFDPMDYILFYGQKLDDKYTRKNIYWLTYGQANGLRMTGEDGTPAGMPDVNSYSAESQYEQDLIYSSLAPGADDIDRFVWRILYSEVASYRKWDYAVNLPAPDGGSGYLDVKLLGALQNEQINLDHHAIISVNNVIIADVRWDGITWQDIHAEIPSGLLLAGSNTISVAVGMDTGAADFFYVDKIKIQYSSGLSVDSSKGMLFVKYDQPGTWTFPFSGFLNSDLTVFDITDPTNLRIFENGVVTQPTSMYTVTIQADISHPRTFLALSASAIKTVAASAIQLDSPSSLFSLDNQADFIIISHAAFISAANQLADYRKAQGVQTMVVDVQDVYDEFNYGVTAAKPIHDFIQYAYEHWQVPAPVSVLLVGDGNYDPKNNLTNSLPSYIPPYLANVDPWIGETAADNKYVSISGTDNLADLALGRMSVNSLASAEAMVAKILTYEQPSAYVDWQKSILALAGIADEAGDFAVISDNLLEQALPAQYQAEKNYYGVTYTDIATASAALKASINSGKLIVNFIGHGFSTGWSANRNPPENYLRANDVAALTNTGKYPIILAMTCSEGAYHHPTTQAMGEVITRAADKGAIASWSPTGQGVSAAHDYLDQGFLNAVFSDGVPTIGEAILAGSFSLWMSGSSLYTLDSFILFGDPNLLIARPAMAVDDQYYTAEDYVLTVGVDKSVLRNDMGLARGNPLTAVVETLPGHGILDLNEDGSFEYTPEPDWNGVDQFVYQVFDGTTLIGSAEVLIQVLPMDDFVYLPIIMNE